MHLEFKLGIGTHCYIIYDNYEKLKIRGFCDCCNNIMFLKERIFEELGIEPEYQILCLDEKILNDDENLQSNGINNGREVKLVIKLNVSEYKKLRGLQ